MPNFFEHDATEGETPNVEPVNKHVINDFAFSHDDDEEEISGETPEDSETDVEEDDTEETEEEQEDEESDEEGTGNEGSKGTTPDWIKENRVKAKAYDRETAEWDEYAPLKSKALAAVKAAIDGDEDEAFEAFAGLAGKARAKAIKEKILADESVAFIAKELNLTPEAFKARLAPPATTKVVLSDSLQAAFAGLDADEKEEIDRILALATRANELDHENKTFVKEREDELKELTQREQKRLSTRFNNEYETWLMKAAKEAVGEKKEKTASFVNKAAHENMLKDPEVKRLVQAYWDALREDEDSDRLTLIGNRLAKAAKTHIEETMEALEPKFAEGYVKTKVVKKPAPQVKGAPVSRKAASVPVGRSKKRDDNPWLAKNSNDPKVMAAKRASINKRRVAMGLR